MVARSHVWHTLIGLINNSARKSGVSSRAGQPASLPPRPLQKSHQICTNYRIGLGSPGGGQLFHLLRTSYAVSHCHVLRSLWYCTTQRRAIINQYKTRTSGVAIRAPASRWVPEAILGTSGCRSSTPLGDCVWAASFAFLLVFCSDVRR